LNGSPVSERQQFVGELTGERRDRLAEVKVKNRFALGDHMQLMTPKGNFHFDLQALQKASKWRRGMAARCICRFRRR
jgi:putative protease